MTEQPTKLRMSAEEIIAWAWEHKIPDVPYEKSFDITGPLFRALEAREILPDHGIFEVTEETLASVKKNGTITILGITNRTELKGSAS